MGRITGEPIALGDAAAAELKALLRIAGTDEDALVERLLAAAAGLCEQFTGRVLIARGFEELLPAGGRWTRLGLSPAMAITAVSGIDAAGAEVPIAAGSFAIDIDAAGDGWVRAAAGPEVRKLKVAYEAGLAADWAGLPEPLRHGILRLASHLFTHRGDTRDPGPPAAVTALWRPYRRMQAGAGLPSYA